MNENNLNKKNVIKIMTPERQIELEDGSKMYVIFDYNEAGDRYLALLSEAGDIVFAEDKNNSLQEVLDDGIFEILSDLLDDFLDENTILDKDGNEMQFLEEDQEDKEN